MSPKETSKITLARLRERAGVRVWPGCPLALVLSPTNTWWRGNFLVGFEPTMIEISQLTAETYLIPAWFAHNGRGRFETCPYDNQASLIAS